MTTWARRSVVYGEVSFVADSFRFLDYCLKKQGFPLVETLGHEWVPDRTPGGAERSGALEAKRRVVRTGSRGTIGSERGN